MRNLPWLPRPLVIESRVLSQDLFCLQWNGVDSTGSSTGEQYLFPLTGGDTTYLPLVRPWLYRARFIGPMSNLMKIPGFDGVMRRRYESVGKHLALSSSDDDVPVVLLSACERTCMQYLICEFVLLGEEGRLILPEGYDDPACYEDQVKGMARLRDVMFEERVQMAWRKHYLTDVEDVAQAIDQDRQLNFVFAFDLKPRSSPEALRRCLFFPS